MRSSLPSCLSSDDEIRLRRTQVLALTCLVAVVLPLLGGCLLPQPDTPPVPPVPNGSISKRGLPGPLAAPVAAPASKPADAAPEGAAAVVAIPAPTGGAPETATGQMAMPDAGKVAIPALLPESGAGIGGSALPLNSNPPQASIDTVQLPVGPLPGIAKGPELRPEVPGTLVVNIAGTVVVKDLIVTSANDPRVHYSRNPSTKPTSFQFSLPPGSYWLDLGFENGTMRLGQALEITAGAKRTYGLNVQEDPLRATLSEAVALVSPPPDPSPVPAPKMSPLAPLASATIAPR